MPSVRCTMDVLKCRNTSVILCTTYRMNLPTASIKLWPRATEAKMNTLCIRPADTGNTTSCADENAPGATRNRISIRNSSSRPAPTTHLRDSPFSRERPLFPSEGCAFRSKLTARSEIREQSVRGCHPLVQLYAKIHGIASVFRWDSLCMGTG